MKTLLLFLLACCLFSGGLMAQTLKGKVTGENGEPVPHAAIYIREQMQGIAADDRGEFQTTLPQGEYTLEISSLGFDNQLYNVSNVNEVTTINIRMKQKSYALPEVIVTNKKEDPAYGMMRKAIAKAPYYLHQVKSSRFETYTKESVKINKMPALIGNMKIEETGKRIRDYSNKLYVVEVQQEISYLAPNTYDVNTIAYSSTAPKDIYDAESADMEIATENIYAPKINEWISPLAPDALTYYNFKYEDVEQQGNIWVNKIKVTPKKKNPILFSGWIYIADKTWHVMHVDLTGSMFGATQHIKVNYNEVKPLAFLPTSYDLNMDIDVMGIEVNVKHYSSLRYNNLELDGRLDAVAGGLLSGDGAGQADPGTVKVTGIMPKEPTPKQQKAQRQLEDIVAKEKLNNRDAYKMAKLMQDIAGPKDTVQDRKSLEIREIENNIKTTIDSMAKNRDSKYWSIVRDLPLREEEVQSYERVADEPDIQQNGENRITVSMNPGGSGKAGYLFGREINMRKNVRMKYGGLLGIVPEYNFVDGFWLGQRLTFDFRNIGRSRSLKISPSAYYVTARKTVNWNLETVYGYAPMHNGSLRITGGDMTADYNGALGNSRTINSLASILFAENRMKFYRRQFVEAHNSIDLANGLVLQTDISYEKRHSLSNNVSFSIFGDDPFPNSPFPVFEPEPTHTAAIASIRLLYTPRFYYRISDGRKIYEKSSFPTFGIHYRKAFPVFGGDHAASFDMLEAMIRQRITLNLFDNINYYINAGLFLSSK
ncbi:MAG: DUF5686 and carboxypeptidase regulatory-like domain-containing protein, partial [Tannerella sp.]|nr:DUF5686 and carboxypeptidase regulatory-like domain-containing protein [Tannerella sp.]